METISCTNVLTPGLPVREEDHWLKGPSVSEMFPTCLHLVVRNSDQFSSKLLWIAVHCLLLNFIAHVLIMTLLRNGVVFGILLLPSTMFSMSGFQKVPKNGIKIKGFFCQKHWNPYIWGVFRSPFKNKCVMKNAFINFINFCTKDKPIFYFAKAFWSSQVYYLWQEHVFWKCQQLWELCNRGLALWHSE